LGGREAEPGILKVKEQIKSAFRATSYSTNKYDESSKSSPETPELQECHKTGIGAVVSAAE